MRDSLNAGRILFGHTSYKLLGIYLSIVHLPEYIRSHINAIKLVALCKERDFDRKKIYGKIVTLAGSMTGRCKPNDHAKDRKDDQSFCARVRLKVRPQKSTGKFFTRSFPVAVTTKTIRGKYLEQY